MSMARTTTRRNLPGRVSGKRIPVEKTGNTYEIDLFVDLPAPFPRPAK